MHRRSKLLPKTFRKTEKNRQAGVAIILVVFLVALCSILVLNLTYSTFLSNRSFGVIERQLQAEYILKSLLNVSQALIQYDPTPSVDTNDPVKDLWAIFSTESLFPKHFLGLENMPGEITFFMRPANSKFNLFPLFNQSTVKADYPEVLLRLLGPDALDFDNSLREEEDKPEFAGRVFDATEVISNIIDWQDSNQESYQHGIFQGIETNYKNERIFLNRPFKSLDEIVKVPGITPTRAAALAAVAVVFKSNRSSFNINTIDSVLLKALDPTIDDLIATNFMEERAIQPFESINDAINRGALAQRPPYADVRSQNFEVFAKVAYGLSKSFYLHAIIKRRNSRTSKPVFENVTFY